VVWCVQPRLPKEGETGTDGFQLQTGGGTFYSEKRNKTGGDPAGILAFPSKDLVATCSPAPKGGSFRGKGIGARGPGRYRCLRTREFKVFRCPGPPFEACSLGTWTHGRSSQRPGDKPMALHYVRRAPFQHNFRKPAFQGTLLFPSACNGDRWAGRCERKAFLG